MTFFLLLVLAATTSAQRAPDVLTREDPVEIVLYSDFQCPYCAQFAKPFRELQAKGIEGADVRVVFKNFPLSIHPQAQLAHQAAIAAKAQDKFWEMHDLLFANPRRVQRTDLIGYATQLGLDLARFEKDIDGAAARETIAADIAEGTRAGVSGTPAYSINGRLYSGMRPLEQLKELMVGEQRRARVLAEVPDRLLAKGPADAAVTLELFADLQSPVSRPAVEAVQQLLNRHPADVRVQFRNFPLAFHPQAGLAHEAAMIAARDGRFWEFAAFVLDHQDALREQDLIVHAGRLGLDQAQFAARLGERRYGPRVAADVLNGQRRGIRGSPTIVIGDNRIDGVPDVDALMRLVQAALIARPPTAGRDSK
jgi:protein-disulfide isomerase